MGSVTGPYELVRNVYAGKDNVRLKVRVVRMWNVCSVNQPTNPFSVQLVLIDTEGNKIEATIRKPLMKKFGSLIVEGEAYVMASFHVLNNVGSYRATRHEFKLLFNSKTTISHIECDKIPSSGYTLVNSEFVSNTKGESDYLLDVMGVLTAVYAEKSFVREGKTSKVIMLELTDDKGIMKCALFGDYVDTVNEYLALGGDQRPIVIFQLARVKSYKAEVSLQNVMNASKLLWDPQIPEAIEFRNGLTVHGFEPNVPLRVITGKSYLESLHDEFISTFPRKSVKELDVCLEDGIFIVLASVLDIHRDDPWWYMSCTCHKSVAVEDGIYFCNSCGGHVIKAVPRFKVKVDVGSVGHSIKFVLFDYDCCALLKKSCKQLLRETKDPSCGVYPNIFESLIGQELLFKVEKTALRSSLFGDPFKVKKICNNCDIITEFKSEDSIVTPESLKVKSKLSSVSGGSDSGLLSQQFSTQYPKNIQIEPTTLTLTDDAVKPSVSIEIASVNGENGCDNVVVEETQVDLPAISLGDDNDYALDDIVSKVPEVEVVTPGANTRTKRIRLKPVKLET